MNPHLSQVESNEKLLDILDQQVSTSFFDWKIIICFHTALHYVEALSDHKNIHLGKKHGARNDNLNPSNQGAKMPLPQDHFDYYYDMYCKSRECRYDGLVSKDFKTTLRKANYEFYRAFLPKFRQLLKDEKVPDA